MKLSDSTYCATFTPNGLLALLHLWKSWAGSRIIPEQALIDRAIARSTQPPWSLVSEGLIEALIEAELLD